MIIVFYQISCQVLKDRLDEERGLARSISAIPLAVSVAWKWFYLYEAIDFMNAGYGQHFEYLGLPFFFWILKGDEL